MLVFTIGETQRNCFGGALKSNPIKVVTYSTKELSDAEFLEIRPKKNVVEIVKRELDKVHLSL